MRRGPNAFHAFDYLGVGEAARGMAVYIDQLRLMDALTAEEITHIDLGERVSHALRQSLCRRASRRPARRVPEGLPGPRADRAARQQRGDRLRSGRLIGDGAAGERRARHGIAADRRRRAVVERPQAGRRRRPAARVRPHHLPLGDPDRADAGRSALERGDAVGRAEVPHRALSAVGLEGVQPRRHLSQRRAGAGRRQAGLRGGGHAGLCAMCMSARRTSSATARTGSSGCCATAIRSSAGSTAASCCSATPRIRCCNISRKAPAWRWRTRCACRTCWSQHDDHAHALEAYRAQRFAAHRAGAAACRAPSASTSIIPPADTPGCATPSWARRRRRISTATWRGCMAGRGWRGSAKAPVVPALSRDPYATASRFWLIGVDTFQTTTAGGYGSRLKPGRHRVC